MFRLSIGIAIFILAIIFLLNSINNLNTFTGGGTIKAMRYIYLAILGFVTAEILIISAILNIYEV